jgi:hypothetical protein
MGFRAAKANRRSEGLIVSALHCKSATAGAVLVAMLALSSCSDESCEKWQPSDVKKTVIDVVESSDFPPGSEWESLEVSSAEIDFNPVSEAWMVPFFTLNGGRRTGEYFGIVSCSGRVEFSINQDFQAGP